MAFKCDYCKRGIEVGHAVSHAKNRVRRIFKPNLQKLKVLKNGILLRVKFCTSCIKRLRKDGRMGGYVLRPLYQAKKAPVARVPAKKPPKETKKKEEKVEEKVKESLKIESIVGKRS